uniref:BTB domain-containing protein n=1 Tax=Kalanchoe fedtschenkoi TaxID=63787 RepID=A0A7N0TJ08_KALFE
MSLPVVHIVTSTGLRIPTHYSVLAKASHVLENLLDQQRENSERLISIFGVPFEAVSAFVGFLYTARCSEEEMEKYGIHLLALSHCFLIPQLKQKVTKALAATLTKENVGDVLQLAKLCDSPDLSLSCMKFVSRHFKTVETTEGWKILQEHDPWLELEILQFMDESVLRRKRTRRLRREQSLYLQLSEAMECLVHICTEGCTSVGPLDVKPSKSPCSKYATCQGLQMLIRHFASCKKRINGGCSRCKRMWQILHLHSSICDHSDHCRVPLCSQFKMKEELKKGGSDDEMWRQLVRKVAVAKAVSSLTTQIKVSHNVDDVHPTKCHYRSSR